MCKSGKVCFDNENKAWDFVIKIIKKGHRMGNVYNCPDCPFWHTTSKKGSIPDFVADKRNKILSKQLRLERRKRKKIGIKSLIKVPREVRIARGKILKGQLTLKEQKEALNKIICQKI